MAAIDTIREILDEKLDIAPEDVTPESTLESLDIDSLSLVELTIELEDRLGIDLGDFEGDIATIGEFADYVDAL